MPLALTMLPVDVPHLILTFSEILPNVLWFTS